MSSICSYMVDCRIRTTGWGLNRFIRPKSHAEHTWEGKGQYLATKQGREPALSRADKESPMVNFFQDVEGGMTSREDHVATSVSYGHAGAPPGGRT